MLFLWRSISGPNEDHAVLKVCVDEAFTRLHDEPWSPQYLIQLVNINVFNS